MLPQSFKPFFWSFDFSKLDIEKNKKTIIEQILTYGTFLVTKELFEIYSKEEIKLVLNKIRVSPYNKKSINYWNIVLN
jgi:hypothetical protein